jgi:hypothetical protein
LAISPAYISVGRRGVFYSFKLFLPAFAALIGKGGGGQHPWFTQANLVVAREQTLFNKAKE